MAPTLMVMVGRRPRRWTEATIPRPDPPPYPVPPDPYPTPPEPGEPSPRPPLPGPEEREVMQWPLPRGSGQQEPGGEPVAAQPVEDLRGERAGAFGDCLGDRAEHGRA